MQEYRKRDPERYWASTTAAGAKRRSKNEGLPCDVTQAFILRLIRRNSSCFYCGVGFDFSKWTTRAEWASRDTNPSLDKVVPERGYTQKNVVLACSKCNRRKQDSSPEDLERILAAIRRFLNDH